MSKRKARLAAGLSAVLTILTFIVPQYAKPEDAFLAAMLFVLAGSLIWTVRESGYVQGGRNLLARVIRGFFAGGIICAILIAIGVWLWPPIRRHTLTDSEKAQFERPLKAQQSARHELILTCPQADERACIYAAQFINIFKEAGWKVKDDQVGRIMLKGPHSGIVLVTHVDKLPEWPSGVWSAITPSVENLYEAFASIGIEPGQSVSTQVPEAAIAVSFGVEKDNEAEPTDFTVVMRKIAEARRRGEIPPKKE